MGEYDEECFSNVLSDGYTIRSMLSVRVAVAGNAIFYLFCFYMARVVFIFILQNTR
jgi:hypothetical protein